MDRQEENTHNALVVAKLIILLVDMRERIQRAPISYMDQREKQQDLLRRFDEMKSEFK